jgi:hypothetical protein
MHHAQQEMRASARKIDSARGYSRDQPPPPIRSVGRTTIPLGQLRCFAELLIAHAPAAARTAAVEATNPEVKTRGDAARITPDIDVDGNKEGAGQNIVRLSKTHDNVWRIRLTEITVRPRGRAVRPGKVREIAASFAVMGQISPILVQRVDEQYAGVTKTAIIVIDGVHRFEAAKLKGDKWIYALFIDEDEVLIRMRQLAVNLYRSDLTWLERAEHIAELARLIERTQGLPRATPMWGGWQPAEKGVRKTARELGLDPGTVSRAIKIDGIAPEAKRGAADAGLDDNRRALLAIANETSPVAQLAMVHDLVRRNREASAKRIDAKTKAKNAGLNDAQSTLLAHVNEPTPTAQLDMVREIANLKTAPQLNQSIAAAVGETASQYQHLKSELADRTHQLRTIEQEPNTAHRAVSPATSGAVTDASDSLYAILDRRPLSTDEEAVFAALIAAWNDAGELKSAFDNAPALVRERFIFEFLQGGES